MKKTWVWLVFSATVISIVALVFVLGYFLNKRHSGSWIEYSNKDFKFSVKTPVGTKIWEVPAGFDNLISAVDFALPSKQSIRINPWKNSRGDKTLSQLVETRDNISVYNPGENFINIKLKSGGNALLSNSIDNNRKFGKKAVLLGKMYFYVISTGSIYSDADFGADQEEVFLNFINPFKVLE